MTTPTRRKLIVLVPLWVIAALVTAQSQAAQLSDPPGDAMLRRTDPGNDGPVPPTAVLPDITGILVQGWTMTTAGGDPFTGAVVGGAANMVRIDLEFMGMLNPPGPNSGGSPDPYLFGPSPLFGFIEFDIDADADTGGQLPLPARTRILGNLGRFSTRPIGVLAERTLQSASTTERDTDFYTTPFFERSGEDFALSLCGCFVPTVLPGSDTNSNGIFDSGETWYIRGRFFPRAAGYQGASAMGGGSAPGLYDPQVTLRWAYNASSNRTTISLVYPLTPAGAAMLTNQPQQGIDYDCSNHYSVQEALQDIIVGAQGGHPGGMPTGPAGTLVARWAKKSATDFLVPNNYGVMAIVGTGYNEPGTYYAWTDVAFGLPHGDVNGDGVANALDVQAIIAFLGGAGSFVVPNFGTNFSMYDVVSDGVVNATDLDFYPLLCPADWDTNGVVNSTDVSLYLNDWFTDLLEGGTTTDYDDNGVVNSTDVSLYVNTWFDDVIGCSQ